MESLLQQTRAPAVELESAFHYIDPAPHDEVMMEQLEYLLLHCRSGRHAQCPDCARLERISRYLLSPFG